MRIIVDLPAPFGPSRPAISARPTSNDTPSSAGASAARPYVLVSPSTRITREEFSALFQSAVAQRSVVLAAEVPDLVQQRTGDRLVQLLAVVHGPQQVAPVEHDVPRAGVVALDGRACRRRRRPPLARRARTSWARPPRRCSPAAARGTGPGSSATAAASRRSDRPAPADRRLRRGRPTGRAGSRAAARRRPAGRAPRSRSAEISGAGGNDLGSAAVAAARCRAAAAWLPSRSSMRPRW